MWIDNINFNPVTPRSGLLGFASVDLFLDQDTSLLIGNIAVYSYKHKVGYRVTYPTRKCGGSQFPIWKPNNPKLANKIRDAIVCHVEKLLTGEDDGIL